MLILFKPLENKGFINKKGESDLTLPSSHWGTIIWILIFLQTIVL